MPKDQESSAHMLTKADRIILRELQRDCRITNQALASAVSMSTSACWRRVQTLEAAGVISGYMAQVDPRSAGLSFAALVQVSLARHQVGSVDEFTSAVSNRPEVLQCFATTGAADYILRVVAEDIDGYTRFLNEFLFAQPGVVQVNTSVVMDVVKDSVALPV